MAPSPCLVLLHEAMKAAAAAQQQQAEQQQQPAVGKPPDSAAPTPPLAIPAHHATHQLPSGMIASVPFATICRVLLSLP